jgi:hypothetical protein
MNSSRGPKGLGRERDSNLVRAGYQTLALGNPSYRGDDEE